MISYIHIIEALLLLSGALNSGGVVPPNNHCDIENFHRANGRENLVPGFIAEEIEVRQIAQLSNQDPTLKYNITILPSPWPSSLWSP